ncbi:MAG: hypothetical protein ABIQ60_05070 [Burkholderiaceae bacterium]
MSKAVSLGDRSSWCGTTTPSSRKRHWRTPGNWWKPTAPWFCSAWDRRTGIAFTQALRKKGVRTQLVGLSVMSSDSLYAALGEQTRGMIVTQVVPFPWSPRYDLTADYRKLMEKNKIPFSIDSMEGFMSARLLV